MKNWNEYKVHNRGRDENRNQNKRVLRAVKIDFRTCPFFIGDKGENKKDKVLGALNCDGDNFLLGKWRDTFI